jgi:hypothetical protein
MDPWKRIADYLGANYSRMVPIYQDSQEEESGSEKRPLLGFGDGPCPGSATVPVRIFQCLSSEFADGLGSTRQRLLPEFADGLVRFIDGRVSSRQRLLPLPSHTRRRYNRRSPDGAPVMP